MGKLLDEINGYFKNTPNDEQERYFDSIKYLNEIGPDVIQTYKDFNNYSQHSNNDINEQDIERTGNR